ncbi:MAG TPA: hypothetical protein PLA11_16370 [Flavobacteriales bacterium]|nr:hypothetical protein [Flavobacteriales bacterium]
MGRAILFLFFFVVGMLGRSQVWCPPGATWHVSTSGLAGAGYSQYAYAGDTLVGGRMAQRITETGYFIDYISFPPDTIPVNSERFTAVDDGVVYLWTSMSGTLEWDTLYWYSAVPGDKWFPAGSDSACGQPLGINMFQVVDTSTVLVDGFPLRQLNVMAGPSLTPFPITERLGGPGAVLFEFPLCIVWEYGELLRCYSDQDLSYMDPNWNFGCASGVGIVEERSETSISVHPTPGHDRFMLELPPGRHTLLVTDLSGRTVHTGPVETGIPVHASRWPVGTYVLRLPELGRSLRWVKE